MSEELMWTLVHDELKELRRRLNEISAAAWASALELQALVRASDKPNLVPARQVLEIAARLADTVQLHRPGMLGEAAASLIEAHGVARTSDK